MHTREKTATDYEAVCSVVKCAFESAGHADGNEQDLVNILRKEDVFVPELSLVVEADGEIVDHIVFTRATVNGKPVLALVPLSVLPEYQRKGIGRALIREGHRIAKELGYTHTIVLGSEKYYPKSGYSPAEGFRISAPFNVPSENFMTCVLNETGAETRGTIKYAPELGTG